MRAYVTILDADMAILPFFVRHYRRLGATLFPVLVYGVSRFNARTHAAAQTIIEAEGCEYLNLGSEKQVRFSANRREAFIRSQHPAGEWAFFCDLDEFADVTPEFVQGVAGGETPCAFVEGRWRDRVGTDGKLVDIDALAPLESQFPLANIAGRPLSKRIGFGGPCYVLSPFAPTSHHPNACKIGRTLRRKSLVVAVHHFKWQANVIQRLQRRYQRIIRGRRSGSWASRVEKTP